MADGPLTNLAQIQCLVDANGALVVYGKANSGSNSPAKNALNTRGVSETGNMLVVTFR